MTVATRRGAVPNAELAERFDLVRAVPWKDRALAYALCLPKALVETADLDRAEIAPLDRLIIGRFVGAGVTFAISVLGTEREISLVDLARHVIRADALAIDDADIASYGGREAVDLLGTVDREGSNRVIRLVLLRQGARFCELRVEAARASYVALQAALAVSLSTFRFKGRGDSAFIEPCAYVQASGSLPLGVRVPVAWSTREVPDSGYGHEALEMRWIQGGDTVSAIRAQAIDSDALPEATLEKLSNEALRGLTAVGFQPDRMTQRYGSRLPGGAKKASERGEVYVGRAFGQPAEARLALVLGQPAHYAISVVSPPRDADPWRYLVAKRAHEIAAVSLLKPEQDFLIAEAAVQALRPATAVTPIFTATGELDERSFDGFGLDEAAALTSQAATEVATKAEPEPFAQPVGPRPGGALDPVAHASSSSHASPAARRVAAALPQLSIELTDEIRRRLGERLDDSV